MVDDPRKWQSLKHVHYQITIIAEKGARVCLDDTLPTCGKEKMHSSMDIGCQKKWLYETQLKDSDGAIQ